MLERVFFFCNHTKHLLKNKTANKPIHFLIAIIFFLSSCGTVDNQENNEITLLQKSCDKHSIPHCLTLAHRYKEGLGINVNEEKSLALYQRACIAGEVISCDTIGNRFLWSNFNNNEVIKTYQAAFSFHQSQCRQNKINSCYFLGEFYSKGIGTKIDPELSAKFYELSCHDGLLKACNSLGWSYEFGHGKPTDLESASFYYKKSCLVYIPGSCRNLARVQQTLKK